MTQHGATPRAVALAALVALVALILLITECRQPVVAPAAATPVVVLATADVLPTPPTPDRRFADSLPTPAGVVPTVPELILMTPSATPRPPSPTPTATSTATGTPAETSTPDTSRMRQRG